ncbi:MAG: hypothetical protein H8D22_12910 [Candidatus Cloacimonetes bacterium]|nr:hypothetical protein [Candidatus Cloacimonadota bacterium]
MDTLVEKIIKLKRNSISGRSTAREQSKKCAKYLIHQHFTDSEIANAEKYSKPLVMYDIILAKILVLAGNEQLNRRISKIIPMYDADFKLIQLLQDNWQSIVDTTNLERKLVKSMVDGLAYPTGGWNRRLIKMNDYNYLEPRYRNIDTFFVHPDPEFRKFDLLDARYVVIEDWFTKDGIESEFGISPLENEKKLQWWTGIQANMLDLEDRAATDSEYKRGNKYQVLQLEERREISVNLIRIRNEYLKITNKEANKLKKKGIEFDFLRKIKDERIFMSTVVPALDISLQEKEFIFPTKRFSVFPYFSFDFNMPKAEQTSLIYALLDVQDTINKGMSHHIDMVTQMLGSPWFVGIGDKEAAEQLKKVGNLPSPVIEVLSMKNKPEKHRVQEVPQGEIQNVGVAKEFIKDISGITDAMEGRTERSGESGILFERKLGQGLTQTNPYFDALAQTRELITQDFLELVPYMYFEDDRILPIASKDKNALKYDIVNVNYSGNIEKDIRNISARAMIDETENTPNRLARTFQESVALINVMISGGARYDQIPWDLIIKHSPFRDKEEWIQFIKSQQAISREEMIQKQAGEEMSQIVGTAQASKAMESKPEMAKK